MSSFTVPGVRLDKIGAHPNADRLDITHIGGYQAITQKDRFQPGDLAIYVPEQALVPDAILQDNGFWDFEKGRGMLAGSGYNRVKAIKLRGIFSQGLLLAPDGVEIEEGVDYADLLGITKWQPPVPAHLGGAVFSTDLGNFSYTSIENVKKFPHVLGENEIVVMTEKVHGTCLIFHLENDLFYVSSKGLAGKALALKEDEKNFYWRVAKNYEIEDKLRHVLAWLNERESENDEYPTVGVTLFGEGMGVQDLKYNQTGNDAAARFFDLRFTEYETRERTYAPFSATQYFLQQMELPPVPVLYLGPMDEWTLEQHTSGKESITGKQVHIREGVVVQPQMPRYDEEIGRVILKSISPDYLLRRGEATEYE